MEGYKAVSNVYSNYNEYGLTVGKVKQLSKSGELEEKVIGNRTYISVQSLERYIQQVDEIRSNYMTIEEFYLKLTGKGRYNIRVVKQIVEESCLELLIMDIPITQSEKYLIKKSSYEQFLQDYISIQEAYNQLKMHKDIWHFREYLKKQGIIVVTFQNRYELQFVKKEDLNKYESIISVVEVRNLLGLTEKNLSEAIKLCKIESFWGSKSRLYIRREDFELLKNLQEKTLNDLKENTYTWEEVDSLYKENIGGKKIDDNAIKKFVVPGNIYPLVRIDKYKRKMTVYSKVGVDKYIEQLKKDKEISRLCEITTTDYYSLLQQILEIDNVFFSNNASLTKELWYQFVHWKLKNMQGSRGTALHRVSGFRHTTKLLAEFTATKEIYEFSVNELNMGIFNNNIPKKYQREIFSFLYNIIQTVEQKTGKKLFNVSKLNFKYENTNKQEKEIYSVEEYLALYNYLSDFESHKQLAIADVEKALNNKKGYKKYDSFWLYVLLHMNNGWRNGTVLEFPRFNNPIFDKLNLNSIESLENLHLTYNEAERIVKYYQMQWFEHNKTKEKATFYCSSVLTLPMAYAIVICEFRCRKLHLHNEKNLIHFYNSRNNVTPAIHGGFFKNYSGEFKFESRKMNRTVLTYTSSIIKSTFNGDPIEIARHLRGHTTSETTNIYIQLPQEHLDFISEQLFDTGYFGFIYNQVNQLLIGGNPTNRIEQTRASNELKELFGDVVKLEDTTTYLKQLSQERDELGKYLQEMPKEELKNRLNLINLGLSPAKEETYQCFFSSCIAMEIDCSKCPFSIPHFYSLNSISKRIKRTFQSYQEIAYNQEIPVGEKIRLYNLLIIDFKSIMEAKQKFGNEIVEMFLDSDLNDFSRRLVELPDPQYIENIY
ncbi:hypothetical protein [Neobacillus mesonae]|uniref:hypothetical protein n=1 Tax=Neobacillus mesonae TaxID=1193713 RepID=UPI0020423383|nr:hypothetical protein [Neobacillus mesonae]MCM3567561.1 hypothetical protein [Neobacillus mesonae]